MLHRHLLITAYDRRHLSLRHRIIIIINNSSRLPKNNWFARCVLRATSILQPGEILFTPLLRSNAVVVGAFDEYRQCATFRRVIIHPKGTKRIDLVVPGPPGWVFRRNWNLHRRHPSFHQGLSINYHPTTWSIKAASPRKTLQLASTPLILFWWPIKRYILYYCSAAGTKSLMNIVPHRKSDSPAGSRLKIYYVLPSLRFFTLISFLIFFQCLNTYTRTMHVRIIMLIHVHQSSLFINNYYERV